MDVIKYAFVICSRSKSERLTAKCFQRFLGITVLEHLIARLSKTGYPIFLAVPWSEKETYDKIIMQSEFLKQKLAEPGSSQLYLHASMFESDPLKRTAEIALAAKIQNVIRVTHDKILVSKDDVHEAVRAYEVAHIDYMYSSHFTPGSLFEIISSQNLVAAASKYKDVEFLGYAVRPLSKRTMNFKPSKNHSKNTRLLIDYPEDLKLFEVLFSQLGVDMTLDQAIAFVAERPWIRYLNVLPKTTVYTCVYNGHAHIEKCMESVSKLKNQSSIEHIIIDDCSTDKTLEVVARHATKHNNVRWYRNEKNLGLASSSNIAIKKARGKYIVRMDADDYFMGPDILNEMRDSLEAQNVDVIYPDNYFGSMFQVQPGNLCHHVGGALFNKDSLNFVKFTDDLRGYDGLDLFVRAKQVLKIGYMNKPAFMYSQRSDSMSKTNLKERAQIKEDILKGVINV